MKHTPLLTRELFCILRREQGFYNYFRVLSSYTAEDTVEFHLHGSPAVVNATLASLAKIPSFRCAEPGEFTKRAFLNGKMSFLEVEALGDLLNAETEKQRQQAFNGMSSALDQQCWKWRNELMHCLAHAEVCSFCLVTKRQFLTFRMMWMMNRWNLPILQKNLV